LPALPIWSGCRAVVFFRIQLHPAAKNAYFESEPTNSQPDKLPPAPVKLTVTKSKLQETGQHESGCNMTFHF
jgi:hypothetical protein